MVRARQWREFQMWPFTQFFFGRSSPPVEHSRVSKLQEERRLDGRQSCIHVHLLCLLPTPHCWDNEEQEGSAHTCTCVLSSHVSLQCRSFLRRNLLSNPRVN